MIYYPASILFQSPLGVLQIYCSRWAYLRRRCCFKALWAFSKYAGSPHITTKRGMFQSPLGVLQMLCYWLLLLTYQCFKALWAFSKLKQKLIDAGYKEFQSPLGVLQISSLYAFQDYLVHQFQSPLGVLQIQAVQGSYEPQYFVSKPFGRSPNSPAIRAAQAELRFQSPLGVLQIQHLQRLFTKRIEFQSPLGVLQIVGFYIMEC